jgi:undecaprenyl-diphosphatase
MGRATILLIALLVLALLFYLTYRWVAVRRDLLASYGETDLAYPPVARFRARYDRQLHWLSRRLTPGQYLGLHLTVGLLVAAGCLWLFGGLAEDIVTRDPLVRFDQARADYLHNLVAPPLTAFFLFVTALGSIEALGLLGVLAAAILAYRKRWLLLVTWLVAVFGGASLNVLLKQIIARPRPAFADPLLLQDSFSFPSGHSMALLSSTECSPI